jgi:hypothetical protein
MSATIASRSFPVLTLLALLVQKCKHADTLQSNEALRWGRCSVYLRYWYKSANAVTRYRATRHSGGRGAQFTCVTGTKVQIVTAEALRGRAHWKPARTGDVSRGWQHAHELAVFDGLPRIAPGNALIQP